MPALFVLQYRFLLLTIHFLPSQFNLYSLSLAILRLKLYFYLTTFLLYVPILLLFSFMKSLSLIASYIFVEIVKVGARCVWFHFA